jgi:glutamate-1-semialdehyde 2,1-aminomutase
MFPTLSPVLRPLLPAPLSKLKCSVNPTNESLTAAEFVVPPNNNTNQVG